jgi:acyl carrier protein
MGKRSYSGIMSLVSVRDHLVQELSELLCRSLRLERPQPALSPDEPLLGGRLPLDSVDALQWAVAIERHFHCELSDHELAGGALESLGAMADVLMSRGLARCAQAVQDHCVD